MLRIHFVMLIQVALSAALPAQLFVYSDSLQDNSDFAFTEVYARASAYEDEHIALVPFWHFELDREPFFPGGPEALTTFFNRHGIYPPTDREGGREGKVILRFLIESDGYIGPVQVLHSPSAEMTEAVIRVVRKMPPWRAGVKDGQCVRAMVVLPVYFRLQ